MTLLAAYNFDEASGNILDSSGNARTVTFGGSLTRVAGHTSTALSQSTTATDSAGPSLTGMQTAAFTIMGWIRRSGNSPDGWLMEFKQSGSGDRGFLMAAPNIQGRVKNVAGTVFTAAVAQPTAGTAYHAAATCDGSTLKLFINGSEVASTAFSGGLRTNSTSSSFIDGLGTETWLDDARYYDAALDAATITTLMNTPVPSGGGTAITPAAETDTAQTPVRQRIAAASSAAETDTAQTPIRQRLAAAGTATETDTAQTPTRSRLVAITPATETDAAQTPARTRTTAVLAAVETDTALPPAQPGGTPITPAAETDTALTPTRSRIVIVAAATETDQALSPARQRLRIASVAVETDTARTPAQTRATLVPAALETDEAIDVHNPNEVLRDLDLKAILEPARFSALVEPNRLHTLIEPARFRTEIEA